MEAVAADDELAVDALLLALVGEDHGRAVAGDVAQRDVVDLEQDRQPEPVGGVVEVLLDHRLAVRHELRVGVAADVEVEEVLAAVGDAGLGVDVALGVHPCPEPVGAQHLDRAPLEHAGTDARQHVLAALALDHDALDPGVGASMTDEQRPGGSGPDDRHLGRQRCPRHRASMTSSRFS